jgi:hypothetical protein
MKKPIHGLKKLSQNLKSTLNKKSSQAYMFFLGIFKVKTIT